MIALVIGYLWRCMHHFILSEIVHLQYDHDMLIIFMLCVLAT